MNGPPPKPQSVFFSSLLRTHARIEERVVALEHAADLLAHGAHAEEGLAGINEVLDFFTSVGQQHHDDEEKTLFPRLRALPAFEQMLSAFDFQHRMSDTEHAALATRVREFTPARREDLRALAYRYAEVQRAHMLAEERALFPLAEKSLTPGVLAEMARELRVGPNA